jgi:hypothetical protein
MYSRMHLDAEDNLLILLRGHKKYRVISPDHATSAQTVSPTYHVSSNGFSFRGLALADRLHTHPFTRSMDASCDDPHVRCFDLHQSEMLFLPAGWFHQVLRPPLLPTARIAVLTSAVIRAGGVSWPPSRGHELLVAAAQLASGACGGRGGAGAHDSSA